MVRAAEVLDRGKARTVVRTDPGMRARGSGETMKRTEERGLQSPELKEKGQLTREECVGDAMRSKEENGAPTMLMGGAEWAGHEPEEEGREGPEADGDGDDAERAGSRIPGGRPEGPCLKAAVKDWPRDRLQK